MSNLSALERFGVGFVVAIFITTILTLLYATIPMAYATGIVAFLLVVGSVVVVVLRRRKLMLSANGEPKRTASADASPHENFFSWISNSVSIVITFVIATALGLIVHEAYEWSGSPIFGTAVALIVGVLVVWQSTLVISEDPPYIGVLTIFGRLTNITVSYGRHYALFRPFFMNYIPIKNELSPLHFDVEGWTPDDNVKLVYPVDLDWIPDPQNPRAFVKSGKEEGVNKILNGIGDERFRIWISSLTEGPKTWKDARSTGKEALYVVLKSMLRLDRVCPNIVPHIPSEKLRRIHFWGEDPEGGIKVRGEEMSWRQIWEKEYKQWQRDEIIAELECRDKIINDVHQGMGRKPIIGLGIILNRLNIGNPMISDQVAEAAERHQIEKLQRVAEREEAEGIRENAALLLSRQDTEDPEKLVPSGLTMSDAILALQVERGKAHRTDMVSTTKFDPDTRQLIEGFVEPVHKTLAGALVAFASRVFNRPGLPPSEGGKS